MPAYPCLIFADAHLRADKPDTYFAFTQIVSAAIRSNVNAVVGLGDLIDRQTNRASPIVFLSKQLARLKKAGIPFFYVQGNHDFDSVPWLSVSDNAIHIHKKKFQVGPYVAYGLDYQPILRLQDELAEVPGDVTLLFCHQTWGDWMGDVAHPQGEFVQIPGHVEVVVSGDLHQTRFDDRQNADGGRLLAVSPGATCAQKINEPHTHHYVLINGKGACVREALKSRVFIDWTAMHSAADLDAFVAGVNDVLCKAEQAAAASDYPADMAKPYLSYTYSCRLLDAVRRVEKAVAGRAILYERELPPEEKVEASKAARLARGVAVTPLTVLPQELNQDEEPEAYSLVTRLLNATDKKAELARWRTEMLEGA